MSKLSLLEIAQSQLDKTPVIDGQLIVCLDTGNAYRDTATAHVKIGSDLEVVSDLPLAPLAEKIYYLKPDKLYAYLGGNWTLLNDKTIDLDKVIAKLPAGSSTALNDDVEIITQDTDTTQAHYYRRKLVVIWEYIKTKAQDFFAAKNHKHKKADITDFPTSMPASDVYPWAKAAKKPSYTKAEIGLGKVDNTADADKTVKRATTAGTADSANSVAWENVKDKPTTFPVEAHNHDDRYYTEAEVNSKLNNKVDNTEAGANGLINKLESGTAAPVDNDLIITQWANHTTATAANQNRYVRRPMSSIWSYIKSKADSVYQPKGSYAASGHTHDDRYYTETEINAKLDGKSNTGHTHDDRYYTEAEINTKLNGKAPNEHTHQYLSLYEARPANINFTKSTNGTGAMFHFVATSSTTTGKPPADSSILQLNWDNSGGWDSQLALSTTANPHVYYRNQQNGTWGNWSTLLDNLNYTDYVAKKEHTHTKSQITDFPASLKNPTALTIQTNGTTAVIYDGSAAKTVNITKGNIGLGNVDNTADANKSVKYATSAGNASKVNNHTVNIDVPADAKFTDTNTWRGIQNNLTSDSTDQSLSAAQGKALKALVDGKAPISHTHKKSQITDFPSSMPASDVYAWAKAATKPSYTKAEVGLSNVDNTADKDKSVKYATSAGSATTGLNGVSTCIFDLSSNNGSCVRFYNGLQICFGNSSKSNGVVFKLPFANDNYAVVVGGSDTLKNAWYVAGGRTTTGFNPNQSGFAVLFHWIAIGNWK